MSHGLLNLIIRITVGLALLAALVFVVIAARPGYRYFGAYSAAIGTPQPIEAEWDTPSVHVTITQPAVVSFPADWNLGDMVCMVVQVARGAAPTAINIDSFQPQIRWDLPPEQAVVMSATEIDGRADDGTVFTIADQMLNPLISTRLPFRVTWFGAETLALYDNQAAGGLMCYYFQVPGESTMRIPARQRVTFMAKNTHVMRNPAYFFEYNFGGTKLPPETVTLQKEDIAGYLQRLTSAAPFAVQPETAAPETP